jgi:hypothetical protein
MTIRGLLMRSKPFASFLIGLPLGLAAQAENIVFPADAGVVDVTKAPYNAKDNGKTDDTTAIQKALEDHPASNTIIYLPNRTNLVSESLYWPTGANGGGG